MSNWISIEDRLPFDKWWEIGQPINMTWKNKCRRSYNQGAFYATKANRKLVEDYDYSDWSDDSWVREMLCQIAVEMIDEVHKEERKVCIRCMIKLYDKVLKVLKEECP